MARLVNDMLTKVPAPYDPYAVKERLKIMGHLGSMNIFLRQEIDRIQKVWNLFCIFHAIFRIFPFTDYSTGAYNAERFASSHRRYNHHE